MNIERMSADGLTRETWGFFYGAVNSGGPLCWLCGEYKKETRKNKRAKTWTVVSYMNSWHTWRDALKLDEAPIDDALIAEVRRRAAEAPVVGRRS